MLQPSGAAKRWVARLRGSALTCCAIFTGGCSGASRPPAVVSSSVVLAQATAYLGVTDVCATPHAAGECLRAPNTGFDIPVTQNGNPAHFTVASADPAIVTGSLTRLGPGAIGSPAVELRPREAGETTLTVTGTAGAHALLTVSVTTISSLVVTLDGLSSATDLLFTVSAPAGSGCTGFAAGYSFGSEAPPAGSSSITLLNFPALGNGPTNACVFSTVKVAAQNVSGQTIARKTVSLPIKIGRDNSTAITLP